MCRPRFISPLSAIGLALAFAPLPAAAADAGAFALVTAEPVEMAFRGVSPPVRDLPALDGAQVAARWVADRLTEGEGDRHAYDATGRRYGTGHRKVDDPYAAVSATDGDPVAPGVVMSFDGLSSIIAEGPPDTEGAVGPDHYLEFVNIEFRIFDKLGTPITQPVITNQLWAGSGSQCEGGFFADPVVLYDRAANRWLITYIALSLSQGWSVCTSVSATGDPTGAYFLYELKTPQVPDYPKLGTWPDPIHNAYVMGATALTDPQGKYEVYALDRERLLMGVEPRPAQRFPGFPNFMMPADLDGATPPPAGSPAPIYSFRDGNESFFIPPTPVDTLDVYELSLDWDDPNASGLRLARTFSPPELAEFNWTICGWNDPNCLNQPSTEQKLDSISWIPMQRLQYRNLGAYETLVGVWTVNAVAEGKHAAPRWFELRRFPGGSWQIAYQGTFAPTGSNRWMASVALDGSGNMAMGYSVVDADLGIYPSLAYTVRPVDETAFVGERWLAVGSGYQTGSYRWGDYASMEVDPTDDCTFWFAGEYLPITGNATWATRIGVFRVPGCTGSLASAAVLDGTAAVD